MISLKMTYVDVEPTPVMVMVVVGIRYVYRQTVSRLGLQYTYVCTYVLYTFYLPDFWLAMHEEHSFLRRRSPASERSSARDAR